MNRFLLFIVLLGVLSCNSGKEKKEAKQIDRANQSFEDSLLGKTNWELNDYSAVVHYLKKMRREDEASLTNYLHSSGNALFKKLVDHTRYPDLLKGNEEKKGQTVVDMGDLSANLLKMFMDAPKENGKYVWGHELIQSFIASLVLNRMAVNATTKMFPDEDLLSDIQKGGLQKVKTGSFQMIRGALITIHTDYPLYEKNDIVDLSRFLAPHIQQMKSFLGIGLAKQVDDAIEKLNRSGAPEEAKLAFAQ